MAQQEKPVTRRVALKVIKPGMDSRQIIARFEAERQVLAMMDHPNIAKVFDAGTTESSRPYFVMELVKGMSITEFCDTQTLSVRERLALFVPICNAVQHAHQKGIIHRDIKPSNLLISQYDGDAVPKVIDFGVAKATQQQLTEKTVFTQFGQVLGTLQYMSPEQAEMNQLDIDTRSDIYSLGAVLYELLTGTTPIEASRIRTMALDEMLRAIRDDEPQRPSVRLSTSEQLATISNHRKSQPASLSRNVRGELDWIVMKALDKKRSRRYESASTLARDIEAYLADDPVTAGPPSATYQLRKYLRKNRKLLAIVAAFALIIFAGFSGTILQSIRAYRAELNTQAVEFKAETNRLRADAAESKAAAEVENVGIIKAARAREQRLFYFSRIVLADRERNAENIGGTRRLLDACPTHLRGWEWQYLNRVSQQELFSLDHNSIPVNSVAYSPDGKTLATGCNDGIIRFWDVESRQILHQIVAYDVAVGRLEFTPDGRKLVSTSNFYQPGGDGEIKIWNVGTRQLESQVAGIKDLVHCFAISPDGNLIAFSNAPRDLREPAKILIWDIVKQEIVQTLAGHTANVESVDFSPGGHRMVSCGRTHLSYSPNYPSEILIWDLTTGDKLLRKDSSPEQMSTVKYSPDGQQIASACSSTLRVWDSNTLDEKIRLPAHRDVFYLVMFVSNEKLITSGADGAITFWDLKNQRELHTLRGHTGGVWDLRLNPAMEELASASPDGQVKIWDPNAEDALVLTPDEFSVSGITFSPNGKYMTSNCSDSGVLRIWDVDSGLNVYTSSPRSHRSNPSGLAFNSEGTMLAVPYPRDRAIRILDPSTGKTVKDLKDNHGLSLCFRPDGKQIASLGHGENSTGEIRIWNAESGELIRKFTGHTILFPKIGSLAYSDDGTRLVTAMGDSAPIIWDAETGTVLHRLTGHTETVLSVDISPVSNIVASGGDDKTIKLWDLTTGMLIRTLIGHTREIICMAFGPDGKRLVSGANDNTVKLWDVETGEEIVTLRGHQHPIRGIDFSGDGERIAASSEDGTIRIWEAKVPSADIRLQRRAAKVVNQLVEEPLTREQVIDSIRNDVTFDEKLRASALELAKQYKENIWKYFDLGMFRITRPDSKKEDYQQALLFLEAAQRLNADDENNVSNMLGMARYRVNDFAEAVELLRAADEVYVQFHAGGVPFNLAYLAMAYHKNGDEISARHALERLDRVMERREPTKESASDDGSEPLQQIDYSNSRLYLSMQQEAHELIQPAENVSIAPDEGKD